jgi:GNAT superfamily N-acetyltransferase
VPGGVSGAAAVALRVQDGGAGALCADILAALPTWFGIPESVAEYVAAADTEPTVVATLDGRDCGILTLRLHTPAAAEIVVMGVRPDLHRAGVGRALLGEAERWLAARDVEFLQVKTLSPRHPDPGYGATRAFYVACGFRPLEEMIDLWGPDQPALQLVKAVPPAPPIRAADG